MDSTESTREELKRRLFRKCDRDGDGLLKKNEMRELVGYVGFKGPEDTWDDKYQSLAEEHAVDLDKGIPESVVLSLLDDDSDSGIYRTDGELINLVEGLQGDKPKDEPNDEVASPAAGQQDDESDCRVFFAGANFNTKMPVLRELFSQVGHIEDITLFYMPDGRFRGMGRVLYKNASEACAAVERLHETEVDGRKLLVKEDTRDSSALPASGSKSSQGARREGSGPANSSLGGGAGGSSGSGNGQRQGYGASERSKGGGAKSGKFSYGDKGQGHAALKGGALDSGKGGHFVRGPKGESWGHGKGSHGKRGGGDGKGDRGSRTVFFAGAAFETSAAQLQQVFHRAGDVSEFWLFQLADGRSRGMGVVEYRSEAHAQYAVDRLQGRVIQGRELFVKIDDVGALQQHRASLQQDSMRNRGDNWNFKDGPYSDDWNWNNSGRGGGGKKGGSGYGNMNSWAGDDWDEDWVNPSTPRVFFAGAPFQASAGRIREEFRHHGEVRSFALFRLADGRHRGMGVCTYESIEVAYEVLRLGVDIDGCPLYLQEDMSQFNTRDLDEPPVTRQAPRDRSPAAKNFREESSHVQNMDHRKTVFFSNVPFETTETYLRGLFESVGPVKRLNLYTTPDGKSRGMGAVEYTTQKAAMRAYSTLHEHMVSGRHISVEEYRGGH